MRVVDRTEPGMFSEEHLQDLVEFVRRYLLSDEISLSMLVEIVVVWKEGVDWDGKWSGKRDGSEIRCLITLNAWMTEDNLTPGERIEKLKVILAHEYGHHWTLSHLMNNFSTFNYTKDRLPPEYYRLRGLDTDQCSISPVNSSFEAWCRCDKEIIAEDYKYHFAPDSYGKPHRIVEEAIRYNIALDNPNLSVREFIETIYQLNSDVTQPMFWRRIFNKLRFLWRFVG